MKLTKKLLAVLMTVALVFGSIAVAVYADEPEVTTYEGSTSAYTFSSEKTQVKPGDTVTVDVYLQTNCYVASNAGFALAYSKDFFDKVTAANYTYPANTIADRSSITPNLNFNALPNIYNGISLLLMPGTVQGNTDAVYYKEPTKIYTFTFKVKDDVGEATEGTICIPQTLVRSETNSGRAAALYVNVFGAADVSTGSKKGFTQTTDVSGATITFTLEPEKVYLDFTALQTAYDDCKTLDPSDAAYYVEADYNTYTAALNEAERILAIRNAAPEGKVESTDTLDQAAVNAAATALTNAYAALTPSYVDLGPVDLAIIAYGFPEKTAEFYDPMAYATWQDAYDNASGAHAVYYHAPNTAANQQAVATLANNLKTAYEALVPSYVDLTALQSAINDCSTPEKAEEYYDATAYAAWQTALSNAQAGLTTYAEAANTTANQQAVAALATDLRDAFAALTPDILSLAALQTAVDTCSTPEKAEEFYDATAYAAWQTALAAAQQGLTDYNGAANTAANQTAVATLASDLQDAFAALVPSYVDLTDLQNAVDNYDTPAMAEEYYDAAAYAAWQTALAAAQQGLVDYAQAADTQANQQAVAALASDLQNAFEALVPSYVDLAPLQQALTDYGTPAYAEEFYPAADYARYTAAIGRGQQGLIDLAQAPNTQANILEVASLALDIKGTYDALAPVFVDLSALETAVNDCAAPAYAEEYYDAADYAAWQTALAAAQQGLTDYAQAADTAANQQAVAALAADLVAAFGALTPSFVSYVALEDAIADCSAPQYPQDAYTPDSWAVYADALAAANNANTNRSDPLEPASDTAKQAEINGFATALIEAFDNLTLGTNHVMEINCAQTGYYVVGDKVIVEFKTTALDINKIQVILNNEGGTRTFSRTHSWVVSIKDNGDGTETWSIRLPLISSPMTIKAKAKDADLNWDNTWTYGTVVDNPDPVTSTVYSASVQSDTVTSGNYQVITIETSTDIVKIRLVNTDGSTLTYTSGGKIVGDKKVWTITRKFSVGTYNWKIMIAPEETNVCVDTDASVAFTVKPVIDPLATPSTGRWADACYSATVERPRVIQGKQMKLTVVTDQNCAGIKIVNQYGSTDGTWLTGKTVEGGKATWNISKTMKYTGEWQYKILVKYGSTWREANVAPVEVEVIY